MTAAVVIVCATVAGLRVPSCCRPVTRCVRSLEFDGRSAPSVTSNRSCQDWGDARPMSTLDSGAKSKGRPIVDEQGYTLTYKENPRRVKIFVARASNGRAVSRSQRRQLFGWCLCPASGPRCSTRIEEKRLSINR